MVSDSAKKTILVAFLLCVVCSVLVSGAAILLKPIQEFNQALDIKKNILLAGGLISPVTISKKEIENAFDQVEAVVVNLETGVINRDINPKSFNQRLAAKDPHQNYSIPSGADLAKIKVRAKHALVYLVKKDNELDQIILEVHGKGLWSTLYGFLALARDTTTIKGITFYEHAETPGLGGEIDNPSWKSFWKGKRAFDEKWQPLIAVIKGRVDSSRAESIYQIDGLSGSTLTGRGVTNLVRYWLGQNGYGPFLANIREQKQPAAEVVPSE